MTKHFVILSFAALLFFMLNPGVNRVFGQERVDTAAEEPYLYYSEKLKEAETLLGDDYPIAPEELQNLEKLILEINNTSYLDLIARGRMLLFLAREKSDSVNYSEKLAELSELIKEEEMKIRSEKGPGIAGSITFVTGIVALGLFNLFWYLGDLTFEEYTVTSSLEKGVQLRKTTEIFDTLSYVSGGVCVLSLGISLIMFATDSAR